MENSPKNEGFARPIWEISVLGSTIRGVVALYIILYIYIIIYIYYYIIYIYILYLYIYINIIYI